jgi:hypothetical protein
VSPGAPTAPKTVGTPNPSFSWAGVPNAVGYELVIFDLTDLGEDDPPVRRVELPGAASSWTPSLEESLRDGGDYAWAVRALEGSEGSSEGGGHSRAGLWSVAHRFKVAATPSSQDVREALLVLERYLARVVPEEPLKRVEGLVEQVIARRPRDAEPADAAGSIRAARTADETAEERASVGAPVGSPGAAFGLSATTASATDGSTGVAGTASATAGDVAGVVGWSQSLDGTGGSFENVAGGDLLRGIAGGTEVFSVDGAGRVTAISFAGDGSNLTNVPQPSPGLTGIYSRSRNNSGGTSTTTMISTSAGVCFLTKVAFEDLDSNGEWGQCEVVSAGGYWQIQASLGAIYDVFGNQNTDSDAWCSARCLVWN